jgi:hypothetical protein
MVSIISDASKSASKPAILSTRLMLRIGAGQMEALRQHRRQAFEDRIVARLTCDRPAVEAAARAWVRDAIPTALALGFRTEAGLYRALVALYAAGSAGWETLEDTDLTLAARLALLEGIAPGKVARQ